MNRWKMAWQSLFGPIQGDPEKAVEKNLGLIERIRNRKYGNLDYPIGCTVIVKSNEPVPYRIGTLVGVDIHGSSEIPIVEIEGIRYGIMGLIRKYDIRRARALDKLTPDEQWNVMAEFHLVGE
jgi:hypothetical protein